MSDPVDCAALAVALEATIIERDQLRAALAEMVAARRRDGGFMRMADQEALRHAEALIGGATCVAPWSAV